jgi:hypothetical protein
MERIEWPVRGLPRVIEAGTMILWGAMSAANFAQQLLDFTQGPFIAVGTFITFASGLYAFSEWVFGSLKKNMIRVRVPNGVDVYRRNWDRLGQAVNQGIAMGFLAGSPWFGVALWPLSKASPDGSPIEIG